MTPVETMAPPLTVADLDRRLRAVDPAVVLVPPRLLRRIIKHDRRLSGVGLQVPHRKCYVIRCDALLALAGRDELGLDPDRELPAVLALLPRPDPEALADKPADKMLLKYWRLLFHTAVHRAIDARNLGPAEIRCRERTIGHAAFAEIRTVLRQERFLLPPGDDAAVYEEFAGIYLDLTFFAPSLLPHYFPAIDDFRRIDKLLAEDVNGPALFAATRPAGAADPEAVIHTPDCAEEPAAAAPTNGGPREVDPRESGSYSALAANASNRGNDVRAALRYMQAARVAPKGRVTACRAAAEGELQQLVKRLRPALDLTSAEAAEWREALPCLLAPAACGHWPAEARLLYDLQKICIDHERPVSAPSPAEWVYSWFTRPFVRQFPDMPVVLAVKHLRRAAGRLPNVRLTEAERHSLTKLLNSALHKAEVRLRDRFRPRFVEALAAVGLKPANYPERVSRDKLVEELLDIVAARGFLSQPDLRDALSRNQLKLPDLSGPGELFGGDPLLRANRELAVSMPGVYRRGEIYLRWLQRLSAVTFGTRVGRWLTWNFFLPFGGAFLAIEGPLQIGHELGRLYHFILRLVGLQPPLAFGIAAAVGAAVGSSAGSVTAGVGVAGAVALTAGLSPDLVRHHAPFPLAPWPALLIGGIYFWLLLHVPVVRRVSAQMLGVIGHGIRFALIDAPHAIFRWPVLRAVLDSPVTRFVARFTLKPLLPALVTWFFLADWGFHTSQAAAAGAWVFVATMLFLTTRLSRELEEMTADWAVRRWEYLRDFLPGLFRMIVEAFKRLLEAIDRGLYAVDEWLRFRGTENRLVRLWKTIAGLIWGAVAYFLRFIIVLFIEPQINPIKHFPVVTISHKLLLPMIPSFAKYLIEAHGFDGEVAGIIATLVITKIPGIFGFLVWEFKENWRLYRANRPADLRPVMIGHHGETMPRLLRPGFHSGTLPKLYAKLRRAERRALKTSDWRTARRHLETLHHAEEAICRFVERELLAYVNDSPAWTGRPLKLARIEVGSNQVRIELECPAAGPERIKVTFEERVGWLVTDETRCDWRMTTDQTAVLELALTGFDKVAGVDLRRADVREIVGPMPYEVTEAGLTVWPNEDSEVVYDLNAEPEVAPRLVAGKSPGLPAVPAERLLFRCRPVSWTGWVAAWEEFGSGSKT